MAQAPINHIETFPLLDSGRDYSEYGSPKAEPRGLIGSLAVMLFREETADKIISRLDKWRASRAEKRANHVYTGFDRVGLADFKDVSARPDSADAPTEVLPAITDDMAEVMGPAIEHARVALGATATANVIPAQRPSEEDEAEYAPKHAAPAPPHVAKHRLNEDDDTVIMQRLEEAFNGPDSPVSGSDSLTSTKGK